MRPIKPPARERMRASMRNCKRMLPVEAPMALRTPISCVRSATETSMMFIIPMPPTIREIPATIARMPEMMESNEPAG